MPNLEKAWHADLIITLRKAAEIYKQEPDYFLILEACV
jgi:hypothetical protein